MVAAVLALAVTGAAGAAELAYVQRTSDLSISGTSEAGATTVLDSGSVTYASEKLRIEFWAPEVTVAGGAYMLMQLWDGSTDLGRFGSFAGPYSAPFSAVRYITPSAGSHQYIVKAWKTGSSAINSGSGGSATENPPAFLRISNESAGGGSGTDWSAITGKPTFNADWLTDVDTTGAIDGAVLKYDETTSGWIVATDDAGESGGIVTLSAGDRERLDLNWWGVWAVVGLLLVLMIAPQLMSVMRVTRGMADGRG